MSDVDFLGTLAPPSGGTLPITRGEYVLGAVKVVANAAARDAIAATQLRTKDLCLLADTGLWYQWSGASWGAYTGFGGGGGGGMGFRFTYSATTTDADPGAGTLRISTASYATAGSYTLYVDLLEYGGTDVTAWLDSLDDFVGSVKGIIRLSSSADPTKWVEALLTGWTTASGYRKLSATYLAGPGGLSTTAGDTTLSFDALGVSSNLGNAALTNLKSIGYTVEFDNGNSGTSDAIDWTTGDLQKSTLTGNVTYTFTAPAGVATVQLRVTQDATGGRTITWPAAVLGSPPAPTTTALSSTFYTFFYDGTNYLFASLSHTSLSDLTTGDPHTQYALVDGTRAFTGGVTITQAAKTTGSPYAYKITGGAHTTLTAGAEAVDVEWALNRTVQFATGGITTQRAALVRAPTYGFVGASTITNAATFAITGAPVAGTNATLTNRWALWVQADSIRADGSIEVGGGTVSADTTALVRVAHNKTVLSGRNSADSANAVLMRWGNTTNLLELGDTTNVDTLYIQLKTAGAFNLRFGTVPYVSISSSGMVFGASSSFNLSFADTALVPTINQQGKGSGTGAKLSILAQATGSGTGGALDVGPGAGTVAGGLGRLISGSSAARVQWDDTGVGFFATAPVAKQSITGSRGGNAALADLLTKLATTGLLTDSSSA